MGPLTEKEIRRSFVDSSRSEAMALTLPPGFADLPWDERTFLGWRDDRPPGIALRAADSRMSSRTAAMCLPYERAQSGADVSLFTAKRAGDAGRNGNTVGQYICADLDCSRRVRTEIPPWLRDRDPDEVLPARIASLQAKLCGFADHVVRPA